MNQVFSKLKGGTIYIKKKCEDEQLTCIGYRDLSNELPIDSETSFPTASAGKFFVAVGIMKLIEEGLLDLNTKIGSVLSFDLHSIDKDVSIKELLTHTSGVPNYFNEEEISDYSQLWINYPNYRIRTSKDLLPLFIDKPMQYPKGEKFSYNDSGFVLLGLIIEEITGKLFDEYLKEVIFEPLKMKRTGYYELDKLPKNCSNAYIFDDLKKQYYTNIYSVDVKGTGAGGAFTTALDIKTFWEGLFKQKVISSKSLNQMLSRHVDLDGSGYGLGVWLDKQDNPYFVGEDPGVTFISWYDLKNHQIITLISNYQDNVFGVFKKIKDSLI
jgi:CubicO group peptidase (beta-lactamase class C family)